MNDRNAKPSAIAEGPHRIHSWKDAGITPKNKEVKRDFGVYGDIAVVALVLIGLLLIYVSYYWSFLGLGYQWALAILSLISIGMAITWIKSLNGAFGMFLISGKRGISFIEKLSKKNTNFWNAMAVWGIVLGFGLLAYPLLRGRIDKRIFVFGLLTIFVLVAIMLPYMYYALQFINLPQLQALLGAGQPSTGIALTPYAIFLYGLSLVAGFSGYIFFALLLNSWFILVGLEKFALSIIVGAPNISTVSSQIPGVAPILPGLDIPFIPGIIALAVLLVVHEFSHGVLARIYNIKIKSIGLMIFGVIPMGAFVEPDEEKIKKLDSLKQSNIFSAGISANFIFTFIFFVPFFLAIIYLAPLIAYQPYVFLATTNATYPAALAGIQNGTQLLFWNGYNVSNFSGFERFAANTEKPNSIVKLVTSSGNFTMKAVQDPENESRGLIGVSVSAVQKLAPGWMNQLGYNVYATLGFLFMLNFLVAIVNFLPIPGFDGWRIYKANIKNENLIKALAIIIVAGLLLNVIPLLAHYL